MLPPCLGPLQGNAQLGAIQTQIWAAGGPLMRRSAHLSVHPRATARLNCRQ